MPETPLPELAGFLALFQIKFKCRESQAALERYLSGLLTERPNKNCETPAAIVPGAGAQSLQGLLTQMVWDEAASTPSGSGRCCS